MTLNKLYPLNMDNLLTSILNKARSFKYSFEHCQSWWVLYPLKFVHFSLAERWKKHFFECPALYLHRIIDLLYWMIHLYYCSCSSDPVSCARIKGRMISVPLSSARSSTASLGAQISSSQIGFHILSFVIKYESCQYLVFVFLLHKKPVRFRGSSSP